MSNLEDIAVAAVACEKKYGVPAEFTVAQWAAESAWGKKESGKNNVFGIKFASEAIHPEGFTWVTTREWFTDKHKAIVERSSGIRNLKPTGRTAGNGKEYTCECKFANFASLTDAVDERAAMFARMSRYSVPLEQFKIHGDVNKLIAEIAAAGYATDPNYASLLQKIAAQKNVKEACAAARA